MFARLLKDTILKNSAISIIGFGVTGFLGYIFQFFISRRLAVAEYGEFQSLVALLGILGVGSAALSYFVIAHTSVFSHHQDFSANRQFIMWLRKRLVLVLIISFGVFLILSFPLQNALHLTSVWSAVVIGIAAMLSISTVVYTGVFTGWQDFVAVNTLAMIGTSLKLLAAIAIITFFPSASAATLVLVISVIGTYLVARIWSNKKLKLNELSQSTTSSSWREKYFAHRKVATDLSFILGFTFLALFIQNADILLVKHLASADLAGHYGAFNLLGKMILWINLSIVSVVLPYAIAHEHAGTAISPRVRLYAYTLISLISVGAIGLYLFVPSFVIKLSIGTNYLLYAPALWLIGLMNALLSLLLLEANFAFARRDRMVLLILGIAAFVFAVGIMISPIAIASIAKSGAVAFGLGGVSILLFNLRASRHKAKVATADVMPARVTGGPV